MEEVQNVMVSIALFGFLRSEEQNAPIIGYLLQWPEQRFYRWFAREYPNSFRRLLTTLLDEVDIYDEWAPGPFPSEEEMAEAVELYLQGKRNNVGIPLTALDTAVDFLLHKIVTLTRALYEMQEDAEVDYGIHRRQNGTYYIFRHLPDREWEIWAGFMSIVDHHWRQITSPAGNNLLQEYLAKFHAETDVEEDNEDEDNT
jgi:hypothetical protein